MIRKGSVLSKALALLVAASPVLIGVGAIGVWASGRWSEDGLRLAEARDGARALEATIRQTQGYEPVRAVWREYASSDVAGLVRSGDERGAGEALRTRLAETFERFGGTWIGAEPLPSASENDLTLLRLQARGEAPEAAVAGLLEALEIDTPYVFIDAFDARRIEPDVETLDGAPTDVELRLTLSAYWLSEEDDG